MGGEKITDTDENKDTRPASIRRRTASRQAAVQTLYQQWGSGQGLGDVLEQFQRHYLPDLLEAFALTHLNEAHYMKLIYGVESARADIDARITAYLEKGWTLERINQIDKDILRLASVELKEMPEIPARTIIAEYSAIAASWESDTGYITAILDRLAHHFRASELAK